MYFIYINTVEIIAGVVVASPPSKNRKKLKIIFADLLRCIVDHIIHIHIYFIYTNTVEIIAGVNVVFPQSKNGKF